MREDERELKRWLTSLLPEGLSRQDVADQLEVERKTISTMLNPDSKNFGRGLTMLRYLQLVGAVADAPSETPGLSRLRSLEETVDRTGSATTSALEDLSARLQRVERALGLPDAQATEG